MTRHRNTPIVDLRIDKPDSFGTRTVRVIHQDGTTTILCTELDSFALKDLLISTANSVSTTRTELNAAHQQVWDALLDDIEDWPIYDGNVLRTDQDADSETNTAALVDHDRITEILVFCTEYDNGYYPSTVELFFDNADGETEELVFEQDDSTNYGALSSLESSENNDQLLELSGDDEFSSMWSLRLIRPEQT